ncbi:MAG: PRD domain-containing protein [Lachnospiraceae bacterium]|nr:PRD domain-containing protein [Lachnospiraceae bacterium]HCJ06804.1 transcription antiterminator BglG [Lachnospiraceae bacterium]
MYRVEKVLNHNAVIAISDESHGEYLLMGKGIGFGKKINERMEIRDTDTVYSLQEKTERGDSGSLAKSISPVCLEIADEVLQQARKNFGKVDQNMLFPMADHIEFAVKRIQNHEEIRNPLTDDIRVLFHAEFKTAMCIQDILQERLGIQMDEDEIGYIALHIHSAIEDEKVSQAMQMAQAVRKCVALVEEQIGKPIDVLSLSYNRLMNHIRYMVVRAMKGEELKVSMNDYMELKFPQSFSMAQIVCDQVSHDLRKQLSETEIGYLAMHIERVTSAELGKE